ncbi:MAG: hypothetical protein F6J93_02275 [Oscillatoria sp. SIO1A7]|nr:hypothetical protein [Oscillatoria sp. SIO1A7]
MKCSHNFRSERQELSLLLLSPLRFVHYTDLRKAIELAELIKIAGATFPMSTKTALEMPEKVIGMRNLKPNYRCN